jgi:nucleoside-diphosphate-sugar epimerase
MGTDRIVVVGADGVVGGILARALDAVRVVHRAPRTGEHAIADAGDVVASARVVVNAQGFRPRPGMSARQLDDSHGPATAKLLDRMSAGQTLVHVSSAAVLGVARDGAVSGEWPAAPESFPMPAYAVSKWRAERVAVEQGGARGLRTLVLRPAVVFEHPADGMLATLVRLAHERNVVLRLLPSRARHHFCSAPLLGAVARALVGSALPRPCAHGDAFTVADPFVVTNAQLREQLCLPLVRRLHLEIPVYPRTASTVLARLAGLRGPDLAAQAEVFGVLGMDVRYDARATFERLGLEPRDFDVDRTWRPFVAATLDSEGAS